MHRNRENEVNYDNRTYIAMLVIIMIPREETGIYKCMETNRMIFVRKVSAIFVYTSMYARLTAI